MSEFTIYMIQMPSAIPYLLKRLYNLFFLFFFLFNTQLDRDPDFNFYLDPTRNNTLRAGGAAVYYLDTNVPPNSVAAYFVDVVAPNDTLSVCAVRLVSAGKNMPCFETDRVVNYWSYDEDYQRDRGKLDIGAIRNTGKKSSLYIPIPFCQVYLVSLMELKK